MRAGREIHPGLLGTAVAAALLVGVAADAAPGTGAPGRSASARPPLPAETPGAGPPSVQGPPRDTLDFVVLGHVRGDASGGLHWLLDELLAEVRALDPDLAVLTGDMIWGDVLSAPPDTQRIRREWEVLDDTLATLGIPIYRTPGNHDITDVGSRDIYLRRYGPLPRAVDVGRVRFLLVNSAWVPDDGDTRQGLYVRGRQLDASQVEFLREQLDDPAEYDHAFVFMHHLLWWEDEESPWWRDVHPILARGGVRAVFSGDYGPEKFSHLRRDGVDYYQTSVTPDPGLAILKGHEWNRLLAQQFDNFLFVRVRGPEVEIDVHTIGEVSSGHFTPEQWRAVFGTVKRPPVQRAYGRERLLALWEYPKTRWFAIGLIGGVLLGGGVLGFLVGRRARGG